MKALRISMLLLLLVAAMMLGAAFAQEDVKPPSGMSGSHALLDCDMCHQAGVWHNTNKDVTVCQNCHPDQWSTLSERSMHMALMWEGSLQRGDDVFRVKYCTTCHSPHNNDYLRITFENGSTNYYEFDDFMPLCYNCHFLGEGAFSSPPVMSNGGAPNTTRTTTTTRTVNTTTTTTTTLTSRISITPSPVAPLLGSDLTIVGQVEPPVEGQTVTIYMKPAEQSSWDELDKVSTAADGSFESTWTPVSAGFFSLKAAMQEIESLVFTVRVLGEEAQETPEGFLDVLLGLDPALLIVFAGAIAVVIILIVSRIRRRRVA